MKKSLRRELKKLLADGWRWKEYSTGMAGLSFLTLFKGEDTKKIQFDSMLDGDEALRMFKRDAERRPMGSK